MKKAARPRRAWPALPPRGLRPKLERDQVRDLGIVHLENLDKVAHGQGTEDDLWHLIEAVLTWHRAAVLLQVGVPEIAAQLDLVRSMALRFARTGRVGFSGPEYQAAREGVQIMDQLAELTDKATAVAASQWSRDRIHAARCTESPLTLWPS